MQAGQERVNQIRQDIADVFTKHRVRAEIVNGRIIAFMLGKVDNNNDIILEYAEFDIVSMIEDLTGLSHIDQLD